MISLPERIDSKFRYVLLAASRAEQLAQGALAKATAPELEGRKPSRTAMFELRQGAIDWDYGPAPEPEPEEVAEGEEVEA